MMRTKDHLRKQHIWNRSLWALGLITILMIGAHAYISSMTDVDAPSPLQMSRIDFKAAVDDQTAEQVKSSIWHMKGVEHVYFNHEDDIVVYAHYPNVLSAQSVYESITDQYPIPAERFIVDAEMAASACPVTGKGAPLGKLVAGVQSLFNW